MYSLLGMLALAAASTDLATLEGTTWAAKTWSGAAARGGDPDPYDDESTVEIAGGRVRWTNNDGGFTFASLPYTAVLGNSETIKFSLNSDGDLVVEFGQRPPGLEPRVVEGHPEAVQVDGPVPSERGEDFF